MACGSEAVPAISVTPCDRREGLLGLILRFLVIAARGKNARKKDDSEESGADQNVLHRGL